MVERRLKERDGVEQVVVDYFLDALSYRSAEQRIFLVHHGRCEQEGDNLVVGLDCDPPLDFLGRAQAEALSLSGLLYATAECILLPSKRAKATAEQPLPPTISPSPFPSIGRIVTGVVTAVNPASRSPRRGWFAARPTAGRKRCFLARSSAARPQ